MTSPHDILAALRVKSGTEQMAVFAEALIERNETPQFRDLPLIAAAYMLGRVDALAPEVAECKGSAGPMATRVLVNRYVLSNADRNYNPDDLPF